MHGTIVDPLLAALGPQAILAGADIPVRHERDWSTLPPIRPLAVARPATTADVATVMRLCAEHGVPVVPQGG